MEKRQMSIEQTRVPHATRSGVAQRGILYAISQFCALVLGASLIFVAFHSGHLFHFRSGLGSPEASSSDLEKCAWGHLKQHQSLLDVAPISRDEFLTRQAVLASELDKAGIDAFIAEPSASTTFYANVSSSYELSERPFLVIIDRNGRFTTLVPKFEAGRIAKLDMVYEDEKKTTIAWGEDESPYEVLAKAAGYSKVMVDEHARFMIAAGVQKAGLEVVPMSETVQSLRSIKTKAEIAILRGINTFTIELITSLQKCVKVGESTQATILEAAQALFTRAGVGHGFWAIVLLGEQAAFPHGGSHREGPLRDGEFLLIDIGSELHGYGSDVTRTILPKGAKVSEELLEIWNTVHRSQAAALAHMNEGEVCANVDAASRVPVKEAGYGDYYTHRLGHGLGIEMHEPPYLNGANDEKLKLGEVASNEPGIYVTNDQAADLGKKVGFGVRLEDPILVTENGGVPLTGRTAESPWKP